MKKKILTALVTGATGPLGQNITRALSENGYRVLINYRRNKTAAQKLADETGGQIIKSDVNDPKEVKKMFTKVGKVDVLINGVGDFIYKPLAQTTAQELPACIASNLFSAWYCMREILPAMRRRGFGRIINFGSAGCDQLTARPLTTPYYIAKTGLLMLTRSLARDHAKSGVTINMIAPGVLPHGVTPKGAPITQYADIINGVMFLLSPEAKNLTGAYLEISHGWRPE